MATETLSNNRPAINVDNGLPYYPVHRLMAEVLADLPAIGKNQFNKSQGFAFRGIDDVLDALNPVLANHGVFYVPDVIERIAEERPTKSGGVLYTVHLHVRYRFYGPGGDWVEASGWGEGTDSGDKATNKAMTSAMKYVLFQVFAISSSEQSGADSDGGSPEETVPRNQPPPQLPEGWESPDQARSAAARLADLVNQFSEDQKVLLAEYKTELGVGSWPWTHDDWQQVYERALELLGEETFT